MIKRSATRASPVAPRAAAAAGPVLGGPAANKYKARAVVTEEGRFASRKEYADWCALKLQEKAGYITHLQRQQRFPLSINNQLICTFVADAVFFDKAANKRVVADSKGVLTPVYKLKKKLMKALLNIEVIEI